MSPELDPTGVGYLDSSALVKLVILEPETAALHRELARWPARASSVLAAVEVRRVASRYGAAALAAAELVLARIVLIALDDAVVDLAAGLAPPTLRTLDAIHLATARRLGPDLGGVFTFDVRMQVAARDAALPVLAPSA